MALNPGSLLRELGIETVAQAGVEALKAAVTKVGEQAGGKAGEAVVKKFTAEDRLEAQLLLTQAQFTDAPGFFGESDREGAKRLNEYYAKLSKKKRDRFEKLTGYAWSAMKDEFGVAKTPASTTSKVFFQDTPKGAFMKHFAEVGNLGDKAIALELDKLEKASPLTEAAKTLEKGVDDLFKGILEGLKG